MVNVTVVEIIVKLRQAIKYKKKYLVPFRLLIIVLAGLIVSRK